MTKSLTGPLALVTSVFLLVSAPAASNSTNESGTTTPDTGHGLRDQAPKIYINSNLCDEAYLKTEIEFVNFVRDRKDADIHILVTAQETGSGGKEYTVEFLGRRDFEGIIDTLRFATIREDTDDSIRREMARIFKMGLVRYVSATPLGQHINISYTRPSENSEVIDKWNHWVFEIESHMWLNVEESYRSLSVSGEFSARRVTEAAKTYLEIFGHYSEDKFDFNNETLLSLSRSRGFYGSHYISLSDHWSVGLRGSYRASTYSNLDSRSQLSLGIEYNLFAYSESTRRQLRFVYWPSVIYADYIQETIFDKDHEWLSAQNLSIVLQMIQPWGTVSSSLDGSHYLHDVKKNRLSWHNNLSINLFKGFSFSLNGRISRVRNQISLPKGNLSEEAILLRRQEIATDYNYWMSAGISYTFGSIYNNIVNPRFGN